MSPFANPGLHLSPPGWESRVSVSSGTHYADPTTGIETWVRPSTSLLPSAQKDYHSPEGKFKCVNDDTSTGTWVDSQRQPPAPNVQNASSSNPRLANVSRPIGNPELSQTPDNTTIQRANIDNLSGPMSTMPKDPEW